MYNIDSSTFLSIINWFSSKIDEEPFQKVPSTTVMSIVELNFLKISLYEPAERPSEVIRLSTRRSLFVSTEMRASVMSLNSSILSILSN